MTNFIKIVFTIVVCVCMLTFTTYAQTPCQTVASNLAQCRAYLRSGGTVPSACCNGVRSLRASANTTPLRRAYCRCLQAQARSNGVNAQYAANLPNRCNVRIGYAISYNTNCDRIN